MKKQHKKDIWVGVEQLNNDPDYQKVVNQEFSESKAGSLVDEQIMENGASRRDFLKYLGFGLGAATIAASCEIPVKKAIPYVVKPDEIVPGVATYYASSFVRGGDYCAVLVKTREGRPIKIEGNSLSEVTMGGTSARVQASVLDLYDTNRFPGPMRVVDGAADRNNPLSWNQLDDEVTKKLNAGSQVRIVSHTILSPTAKKAIADFTARFPNTKVVQYDPVSSSAILEANEESFGQRAIPNYHFDRAQMIVSFDADFLGTWVSPIEYAAQYARNRRIEDPKKPAMSRHVQVESHMTLTGSNADNRILVKPSEQGAAIVALYNALASRMGRPQVNGPKLSSEAAAKIQRLAEQLGNYARRSLVVSGSNNVGEQVLVNAINDMLGNYDNTLDFERASYQRQGLDRDIQNLISEMNAGSVDAVFVMGDANPAFDIPNADKFAEGMQKVGLKVSLSGMPNETVALCDFVAPDSHYLESWGDAEPKAGMYSLIQPTIAPLFDTRQAPETLLRWSGSENLDREAEQPYLEYLRAHWETALFPRQNEYATFQVFWDSALHDGVFQTSPAAAPAPGQEEGGEYYAPAPAPAGFAGDVNAAARKVRRPSNAELEISFFETVNMGAGQYANNPWLLEMPDPVNRCAWGNYLAIPVTWDGSNSFQAFKNLNADEIRGKADLVDVEVNGVTQAATVVRQFGQMVNTFGLAIGFGRAITGRLNNEMGENTGTNVYPWLTLDENGNTRYYAEVTSVSEKTGEDREFACVQYHHTMGVTARDENGEVVKDESTGEPLNVDEKTIMAVGSGFQGGITDRSIIYQANVEEVGELAHHIEEKRSEAKKLNESTLYPYEEYEETIYSQGHWWAMHVDLNACIGCGACQVACIAENNVPVVGKTEVARHHEMTWLRIDRYYYGDYENPNVVYQPMMCQHCDNAPCENVCPVAATPHSSEGLNQMTYNRCIGTRYCANNCPYKVRRFNWLDYTTADIFPANEYDVDGEELPFGADNLTRMVLNPDVTVRSRGVIEKCSFCMQRIQEGKLTAKREGRRLRDTDIKTACQTACPTGAIVFGDRNDKKSMVRERWDNPLNYFVLEETNVRSSVLYTAKVNNRDEEIA